MASIVISHELPYSVKPTMLGNPNREIYAISNTISKKVSFNTKESMGMDRYIQVIGLSLRTFEEAFSLTYVGLKQSELDYVESIFTIGGSDNVLTWKPPTENLARKFRLPLAWKISSIPSIRHGILYNLSFTLINYHG